MTAESDSSAPSKRKNQRSCAGCGKHAAPEELVRLVLDPSSGELAVDMASSEFGRGAHVHASPDCLQKALKSGFSRVFKTKVVGEASAIGQEIVNAADRRIDGLLSGAYRARQLAVGSDVVSESLKEGKADLVVVARDAAAATRLPEVERAIATGKAIAFGEKAHLGSLFSKEEVAVIAVLHQGVASAVAQTYRLSGPFRTSAASSVSGSGRGSEEAWSSSEVR